MQPMIFYHSFQRSLKLLLIYPASLAAFYAVYQLVLEPMGEVITRDNFVEASLSFAFVLAAIIAVIVGIGVIAEEERVGTDQFLARLPISSMRRLTEKIVSGAAFLLMLYGIIVLYYAAVVSEDTLSFGPDATDSFDSFRVNLFITLFTAYLFAIAFSTWFKQQLAIFLATLGAEILFWSMLMILFADIDIDWYGMLLSLSLLFLFFALPGILVWKQWTLGLDPAVWGSAGSRTLFRGLVWKHISRDGLLYLLSGILVVAGILCALIGPDLASLETSQQVYEAQNNVGRYLLIGMSVFLPLAVGANAYSQNEGRGLACLIYAHPASRSQIYFSKIVAALPVLLAGWVSLVLLYGDEYPLLSLAVFVFFIYFTTVHISLWLPSPMLVILAGVSWVILIFSLIMGWMEPREVPWYFRGFEPVHDPYLVGLIPLSLITLGSVITAWHMANSRRFLAASNDFRARYSSASTVVTLLLTASIVAVIRRLVEL